MQQLTILFPTLPTPVLAFTSLFLFLLFCFVVCKLYSVSCRLPCRNGIEELNDALLTRGFAMNEEGGVLKVEYFLAALVCCSI